GPPALRRPDDAARPDRRRVRPALSLRRPVGQRQRGPGERPAGLSRPVQRAGRLGRAQQIRPRRTRRRGATEMTRITRRTALAALAGLALSGCASKPRVVLYCSQDREFAQGILDDFTRETGLEVTPKFDTEANKSVGNYTEIVAEKGRPRCDVFWNNEVLNTI